MLFRKAKLRDIFLVRKLTDITGKLNELDRRYVLSLFIPLLPPHLSIPSLLHTDPSIPSPPVGTLPNSFPSSYR